MKRFIISIACLASMACGSDSSNETAQVDAQNSGMSGMTDMESDAHFEVMSDAGEAPEVMDGERLVYLIPGNEVDPEIVDHLQPNYALLDTRVTAQNRLLVFLPGSGGEPEQFQKFLRVAAGTGVHTIGLKYNNQPSVSQLCADQESDCYERTRLDIIYGRGERVNAAHSIVNRLTKLLVHLHREFPEQGWGQYVDEGELNWSKMILSGHSQGGGHVGLIARDHIVDRVIFFNSPSDAGSGSPAPWISAPHDTPTERYFAFIHREDNGQDRLRIYGLIGFDIFGDLVNVDENEPPYGHTHLLGTERPTRNAHAAVISDEYVADTDDGEPVYRAAWRYLVGVTP